MREDNRRIVQCTPVEIEVLTELMRDGAENNIIAKRTFRAEDTIKSHIKRLFQKTSTRNRTHLAISVARREIVVIDKAGYAQRF